MRNLQSLYLMYMITIVPKAKRLCGHRRNLGGWEAAECPHVDHAAHSGGRPGYLSNLYVTPGHSTKMSSITALPKGGPHYSLSS